MIITFHPHATPGPWTQGTKAVAYRATAPRYLHNTEAGHLCYPRFYPVCYKVYVQGRLLMDASDLLWVKGQSNGRQWRQVHGFITWIPLC
jgi:hypothetical protein